MQEERVGTWRSQTCYHRGDVVVFTPQEVGELAAMVSRRDEMHDADAHTDDVVLPG